MHWQFGGNFEPVQMICEVDWKECPKAIANYIWSEIVTDVLDCLRNESIVWRVLAVLSICTIILRIVCSKAKRDNATTTDKEILNKVGYKVEDLELKVNILTYKLQYGSWPLPHQVQKSNFRKNLRHLRLTLSNPNDRNNWIKHVLLSPREKESYASFSNYYPSRHRLTESFDGKKSMYPYIRQQTLPVEHSSRSSKSSSEKSLRLRSLFKNVMNRKPRNENFEMRYRNTISLPLFSKRKANKSAKKASKASKNAEIERLAPTCKKFTKSIDECKQYLRQLHESNKNLGLINSSSETSNGTAIKNFWSDTQQLKCIQQKDLVSLSDRIQGNEANETEETENTKEEKNVENINTKQQHSDHCLELSNAIYPVLQLIDNRLLLPKLNIKFCTDIFPQQSASNMLVSRSCERKKYMESSQETLYQVKRKLESLHNVLRVYELQNVETKVSEKQEENSNRINVCQNMMDTLVSITTEDDNWNKNRKHSVNLNSDVKNNSKEIQGTSTNSSEQYESDETGRSSIVSIQNYSNMFKTYCTNNKNDRYCSLIQKTESKISSSNDHKLGILSNNQIVYSSSVKYEKIPERIYYTISSDSSEGRNVKKKVNEVEIFTSLPGTYVESNGVKPFNFSEQYPVAMETDEEVMVSPTSSRTEVSKDSELEDKSTAMLLQEALQFKKALLTRVESEKICYIAGKQEEISNQSVLDHGKYSYINNNLQSQFLDIISEEQSVSSSTEKNSRTYMFFNLKQDKQYNNNILNFNQQNEIRNISAHKRYLDSKHNLDSSSEYFSLSNIIKEENGINGNHLPLPTHECIQENISAEIISSDLQLRYLNNTLDKSDEKLLKFASCLNTTEVSVNEQDTPYNYVHEKESFKEHFARMHSINEFINRKINSVELFSQDLNEAPLKETAENSNENTSPNFNSQSLKQFVNATCTANRENDTSNVKLNVSDDEKYNEDHEIVTCNPNLTLKRNPGACSLIDQTLIHTNMDKRTEIHGMLLNEDRTYELSPSESKETSTETNLIQDSLTSSINQSNDSTIPEPPSVTILINKSLDEEKLNLGWSNVNNDFSDDGGNEKNINTCSTNTIILQKYDARDTADYKGTKVHYSENNKLHNAKHSNLGKEESNNEADFYKSYSNLVSPHSSIYFTDEAPSCTTKLNNTYSKNLKDYLHSNLHKQNNKEDKLRYEDESLKNIENTETLSICMSNESKKTNVTITENTDTSVKYLNNKSDIKQKLSQSNNNEQNRNDLFSSQICTENTNTSLNKKIKTLKTENETLNNKSSVSFDNTGNYNTLHEKDVLTEKTISKSPRSNSKKLNTEQHITSSPCQASTKEIKENNAMKRMNTTVKSKSQENYTSKSEKLKGRTALQNVKDLNSDLLNTAQTKAENDANPIWTKIRDLSAEPRRNAENNIKLDKKRSQSQVSFRTNESSQEIALRFQECPTTTNSVNYIESLESKSRLKGRLKSLSPTPKTSLRSCIPILKSRLEAARKSENESRPKSPMRGPLTMTMLWRDNLYDTNQNVMDEIQIEGKSGHADEIKIYEKKANDNDNNKREASYSASNINENIGSNIVPREQMVIYVNIFTKYDHNTTKIVDPTKFLEHIKNRKFNIQKLEENQSSIKDGEEVKVVSAENEKNTMHKIITVVSSVIHGNELNQTTTNSTSKTQNDSLSNILQYGKLKNICFLSVEQKEVDVTAKPSVIDTSTSISDLENISEKSKSIINKFQICGTPKELNNEEYIALLEILHQEPNFVHLQELQNVCKKLISEHEKI